MSRESDNARQRSLTAGKHFGRWTLLPCRADVCQECATDHAPQRPHNQESLYYKYKFYEDHGRWPTWADAMAHCTLEMKARWTVELEKLGVTVESQGGAGAPALPGKEKA